MPVVMGPSTEPGENITGSIDGTIDEVDDKEALETCVTGDDASSNAIVFSKRCLSCGSVLVFNFLRAASKAVVPLFVLCERLAPACKSIWRASVCPYEAA